MNTIAMPIITMPMMKAGSSLTSSSAGTGVVMTGGCVSVGDSVGSVGNSVGSVGDSVGSVVGGVPVCVCVCVRSDFHSGSLMTKIAKSHLRSDMQQCLV